MVSTFVAVAWVDRFGRRPLLLVGSVGMGVSLIVVGAMFEVLGHGSGHGGGSSLTGTVIFLVTFIASFAFSLGPVVWTIINEIYPSHIRGRCAVAVAVATAANWFAAWLVSQFFLSLVGLITEAGTFWLFAGFCAVTYLFVLRFVPKTKGRLLEEVERLWGDKDAVRRAIRSSR